MARAAAPTGDPLAPLRDESAEVPPLVLIYGKERFLVDRAIELVKQRTLDVRTRDFNFDQLQGKDLDPQRLLAAARTMPMMAKRRLVMVRDADDAKADILNELVDYLADPVSETCLLFVADKADQRMKFFASFKKRGLAIKCEPLYERQVPAFVREEAKAKKAKLDPGVAELIASYIGTDLGQISDAIERLAIFVGDRAISAKDVEQIVNAGREHTVFELCNAVGQGARKDALVVLSAMMGQKESGVRVVAMLARHVRQLWGVRELDASRASRADMASELGIPPFFVDGLVAQAKRFRRSDFERMHAELLKADRALKSSKREDARILESLVLSLTT